VTRANRLKLTAFGILLVIAGNFLTGPAMAASGCLSACCMHDAAPAGGPVRWTAESHGCCCGDAAETPCRLSENATADSAVFTLASTRDAKPSQPTATVKQFDTPLSATAAAGHLSKTPSGPPFGGRTPLYLQLQLILC